MKKIEDTIKVGDKQFTSTKIDFDSYTVQRGNITLRGKVYSAIQKIGVTDTLLSGNKVLCSNQTIVG